ncbi:hypothetical protein K432DRAFT_391254 [Lepidopterella palustris CBS 459.81]|uniref:Uncharacterized protein n=1 Tax=Lepidopterella palustris CBS 459.81 TaxID=1314670 RepID=A0A8E2JHQ6_9PEZI|nr:hypothetical protein K432DRAFT_391254 [Lepidopterella palustris CBS 459.81]
MTDIYAWRKKINPVRAKTPVVEDAEDRHSEHGSEVSTPHRRSKAKLSRYISNYLAITTAAKPEEFTRNFWDTLGEPIDLEEKVDPLQIVQSISSRLISAPQKPIPIQHNSGLLHLMENYRNLRLEKERIEELLKQTLDGFRAAEEKWEADEASYRAEVRRLELIIAKGKQGLSELIRARQDSVIKRKRQKIPTADKLETAYEFLSREQMDQETMRRSQRIPLPRPISPSGKMIALSKKFSRTNFHDDLPFGTPPSKHYHHSLSQRAKSDSRSQAVANHDDHSDVYSTFSSIGDPLPDELDNSTPVLLDARAQGEDFAAIRDIASLIARRRGMKIESLLPKLMDLLSSEEHTHALKPETFEELGLNTPNRNYRGRLRNSRSQPQLNSCQTRRRHFSFDPGDDRTLTLLDQAYRADRPSPLASYLSSSSGVRTPQSEVSLSQSASVSSDVQKPSKIPSPVHEHSMARMRREDSPASLLTTIRQDEPGRRDSSSSSMKSVITAVRRDSNRSSLATSNRSSAHSTNYNGGQRLADQNNSLRNSAVALAAARAADSGSGRSSGNESSYSRSRPSKQISGSGSTKAQTRPIIEGRRKSENHNPEIRKPESARRQ